MNIARISQPRHPGGRGSPRATAKRPRHISFRSAARCVRPVDDDWPLRAAHHVRRMEVVVAERLPVRQLIKLASSRHRPAPAAPTDDVSCRSSLPLSVGTRYPPPGNCVHPRVQQRRTSAPTERPSTAPAQAPSAGQFPRSAPEQSLPGRPSLPARRAAAPVRRTREPTFSARTSFSRLAGLNPGRSRRKTFPSPQANISASRPSATFSRSAHASSFQRGIIFLEPISVMCIWHLHLFSHGHHRLRRLGQERTTTPAAPAPASSTRSWNRSARQTAGRCSTSAAAPGTTRSRFAELASE